MYGVGLSLGPNLLGTLDLDQSNKQTCQISCLVQLKIGWPGPGPPVQVDFVREIQYPCLGLNVLKLRSSMSRDDPRVRTLSRFFTLLTFEMVNIKNGTTSKLLGKESDCSCGYTLPIDFYCSCIYTLYAGVA